MRIGIFTDTYLPDVNGVVTSIVQEVEQLRKRGHEVFIITSSGRFLLTKSEGNVLRIPGIKMSKKMYNYKLSGIYSFGGARKIKKMRLDVIHIHSEFGIATFGRIFAKMKKIPLVYTYHTLYEDYSHYLPVGGNASTVVQMITKASKFLCEKCDEVIAPTMKTRNIIRSYGVEKYINVIPTGLDLEKFSPFKFDKNDVLALKHQYVNVGDRVLMFVGRLAQEKNVDMIIDAIHEIRMKLKSFKFLIVGDGPHRAALEAHVEKLNLGSVIKFVGKVPNTEVAKYYQIADAFISASSSETQGLTFIEGMASKLPILGIDDDAAREVIEDGDNGWIFKDIVELKKVLLNMASLSDEELSKMGAKALIYSEKYSADRFGDKVEGILVRAVELYSK